jgi:hypothetical protein
LRNFNQIMNAKGSGPVFRVGCLPESDMIE